MTEVNELQKEVKVSIGDIVISLVALDPDIDLSFSHRDSRRFVVSQGEPEACLYIHRRGIPDIKGARQICDSGGVWTLFLVNRRYAFRFVAPISLEEYTFDTYQLAILEPDFKSGDVYLSEWSHFHPFSFPFDEILINRLLSLTGVGTEMHACGISVDGRGMVFAGASGAGKSTISRLWNAEDDVTVLSDDRVIIRKKNGSFWVYGTPWHGDANLASPKSIPLERIFFLRHSEENVIIRKFGTETASILFTRAAPPFYDVLGTQNVLDLCCQLADRIPCYELGFVPDASVIDAVRSMDE